MKQILLIVFGIICLVAILIVALPRMRRFFPGWKGKLIESWETSNTPIRVRIDVREVKHGGLTPGANYVFQSAAYGSEQWTEIMTFRHDDQVEIPRDKVHIISEKFGYVYMGWKYAVTTDGGASWSVWDAEMDLPGWKCCNYRLIRDVRIAINGTGAMTLNSIPGRAGEVPELHTKDYGKHWEL